jgi:hypothetical protein
LGLSVPDGADEFLGDLPGGREVLEVGRGGGKSPQLDPNSSGSARPLNGSNTNTTRRASAVPAGGGSRRGSESVGELGERTTSPLSFSPSTGSSAPGGGGYMSPYGGGGSLGALGERDPSRIYGASLFFFSPPLPAGKGRR